MSIATLTRALRQTLSNGRNRSILTFFVTSLSGRGIGIVCQLVQVPLALHYLGKEAFGVWVTLASISYLISFSDFGIGMGAQNKITEALGVGDPGRARKLCTTTLVFLCAVAAVLMSIGLPVFAWLPWGRLFKLSDPVLIGALPTAMTLFLMLACLNVPACLSRRLTYATQQAWLDNVVSTASSVLNLLGVFLGAYFHLGFAGYVLVTWAPGVAASAALLVYQRIKLEWLHGGGAWFDRAAMQEIRNLGLLFGVQQVCTLVLFGAPPLLISTLLGAPAIIPYNLVQRVFNVFQMFQNAFLLPLWPAYADAKAKGDWPWMVRTLRRSMLATLAVAIIPMVAVSFVAQPLIRLWTGISTPPSGGLIAALLLWNIVVALQQPLGYLLAGVSEVKRNTVYSLLTAGSAIVLMPLLARYFGVNGIVMGLVISNAAFSLTGGAYEVRKYIRRVAAGSKLAPAPLPVPETEAVPQCT